jgi:lipopolysaccharide export system permease protein
MRLSATLSRYLGRHYLVSLGFVFLVAAFLVFLADLVETLRRSSSKDEASLTVVLELALLRLPSLSLKLLPFAALFGGIWSFSRLTRTQELVVARAGGVSVWQFLAPALVIALALGGVVVTVVNPLAAVMISRFEHLEAKYLEGRSSLLAFSSTGLWLRQANQDGQSVIHALGVSAGTMELRDVIVFLYEGADKYRGRIDAKSARLHDGYWTLSQAQVTEPGRPPQMHASYELATELTPGRIQESFASPETLSFWALPGFIKTLEAAGFSAVRHRLHWHSVLATPLLLCAMVLLAATFSLRLIRRGLTGLLIVLGVGTGFVLYFVSDVVYALGTAGNLPVALAAWTPAGVSTMLGLAMLFHLEDG